MPAGAQSGDARVIWGWGWQRLRVGLEGNDRGTGGQGDRGTGMGWGG